MCYNKQEQLFRTVQFTHLYAFRNRFEKYTSRGDTVVKKEMIAMLLAGGQGSRLGVLTSKVAKPAVAFGGKYRIIDFPLSNCINSGIDTVGVLTQYQPLRLNTHIGIGIPWDLDKNVGGVTVLPPYEKVGKTEWYTGTANAIYQNLAYMESFNPDYVLILSGDHIYKMDYEVMLDFHKAHNADVSIAVMPVPQEEASRFGIVVTDETGRITEFQEKPAHPKSNLASMGIYIFNWKLLRKMLVADMKNAESNHDFGKDIIPALLADERKLMAYKFKGYWKDVGTIDSLWEANMDLIETPSPLDLSDPTWKIYTEDTNSLPQYIGEDAKVSHAYINQGCVIEGEVKNSVLFTGSRIAPEAKIIDSVLMPNVIVEEGAVVTRALIADGVRIGAGAVVGSPDSEHIELIAKRVKGEE